MSSKPAPTSSEADFLALPGRVAAPAIGSLAGVAAVAAYAAAMLPNILSSNYAPDELWFADVAFHFNERFREVGFWRYALEQTNHLGYGPIYWMAQTLLTHFFSKPMVASRVFGLVCLLAVPLSLIASRPRGMTPGKWLALALWWTFPAAWWTGKLTGPELPSLGAAALGLTCLTYSGGLRRFVGWALLGVALGIKATAAPLFVFGAVLTWGRDLSRLSWVGTAAAGSALGFSLASPILWVSPRAFLITLKAARGTGALVVPSWMDHITARLNAETWTWDALPNGGLVQWSLAVAPLVAFAAMLCWGQDRIRIGVAFLGAAALSAALCLTSEQYYGWYWFGTLLIFPYAWIAKPRWSPANYAAAVVLVGVNAGCNVSTIVERYASKMQQQTTKQNKSDIQQCIELAAGRMEGIDTVLDYSELFLDLNYNFVGEPHPLDKERIVPPGRVAAWLMGLRPLPPLGNEALVVVGDRLKKIHAPHMSAEDVAAKLEGARQVEFVQSCPGMNLYRVNLRKI